MPDLNWNIDTWNSTYDWSQYGEEWSYEWGSSIAQWFSSIYPRIHNFLGSDKMVVEIAPGFGRWTKFLLSYCQDYRGFDISEQCIKFCQQNFSQVKYAQFYLNDGTSLKPIPDNHCDFVFSFDSLVHVEIDIISKYIEEILRIINSNGVAFIHHSNWNETEKDYPNTHNRGKSVSAQEVRSMIEKSGGQVIIQEKINWGSSECIDCLTLFRKNLSPDFCNTIVLENPHFMEEAKLIRSFHEPYNRV